MKRKILLAVFIFTTHFVYSQKERSETKYSVGLKVYTPINLTGTDKFFNDDWILFAEQERTYTKYAIGLDFKYYLNENVSLKLWGGISKRNLNENFYKEFPNYFSSGQNLPTIISEKLDYDQTSFNISPGFNFSTKINKFELNTGFELSYLHTGRGNQTYNGWMIQYRDPDLKDSIYLASNGSISSGNSYGIGAFIGAEYNIFNNFSVGTEFHAFLFYSVFNGSSVFDYYEYYNFSGEPIMSSNYNRKTKESFKQFSFTTILPVIELRYKF